ncbi:hypothetical protein SM124_02030 [Bacillus sp. 31A1R]|uniref:YfhD family protein n=1 Tax=Robertmurraya mangrovi TaxID=3098077 RepID=A0ABU5ITS0_9BACI|nr:hypothetical protein [Bacillus sp. 31A1R]MDZ5470518.1 hypothetical protein [Bacillus sp. 31A1R]
MGKRNDKKDAANVEFGIEFGDLNAAKNYEVPFMNQNANRKNNKKK